MQFCLSLIPENIPTEVEEYLTKKVRHSGTVNRCILSAVFLTRERKEEREGETQTYLK